LSRRGGRVSLLGAVVWLLAAGALPAAAAEPSPPPLAQVLAAAAAPSPPPPEPRFGITGVLQLKNFSHFSETPRDHRYIRNEAIAELKWKRALSPWSEIRLAGDVRVDDDEFADGVHFQIPETTKRRSMLNLTEGVLRLHKAPVEVTFGKQTYSWGTADAINPTDYLNPYDLLDVLDRTKIGIWSAAFTTTGGPLTYSAVFVPTFTPSRDPLPRSRWAPRIPPGFVGVVDDRELPGKGLDTWQVATRLKATVRGWDASISYYDGYENTPVVRRRQVPVTPFFTVPRLTPVYTRLQAAGVDFSTTFDKLELHGEGAFKFVEQRGRDDRFQWIVGANYPLDELPVKWLERIDLVLEYARETLLDTRENSPFERSRGFFSAAFRNAMAGRVRLKFNEETQFAVSGSIDFESAENYYVQFKLTHKLSDAFHVEGGVDIIAGPQDSFWGRWRDNDRAFAVMKYFF
jgi:hypothetical protein